MPRHHPAVLTLVILALAVLALACGGDDGGESTTPLPVTEDTGQVEPRVQLQPDPAQPLEEKVNQPDDGVVTIATRGSSFLGNHVSVRLGETAVIRVVNEDGQTHNLRLAGADGQYDTEDDAMTEPAAIPGGAGGEITFAPAAKGAYTFRCDFHPGSMGGQIVVQ